VKAENPFPAYTEFARCAGEGVVDLSDGFIPLGIPLRVPDRSPFDWLALHLFYVFSVFCDRGPEFYKQVLAELDAVKTEKEIRELLEIEEKHSAVELVGYEQQRERLELIKKALGDAIKK
jgi:hypothetical protein